MKQIILILSIFALSGCYLEFPTTYHSPGYRYYGIQPYYYVRPVVPIYPQINLYKRYEYRDNRENRVERPRRHH